jgi:arsenite methyltransferase
VTGEAIRPGGLALTDYALDLCGLPPGARALDVGCGTGATVAHLRAARGLDAYGLDLSRSLLGEARGRERGLPVCRARGESLPFADEYFDALLVECTLSLMDDPEGTLAGFYRVLRRGGWLIVSDIYGRGAAARSEPGERLPAACCLNSAFRHEGIVGAVERAGFDVACWEDHSAALRQLAMAIIMTHGSLAAFWGEMLGGCEPGRSAQAAVSQMKPGYFLLVGRRAIG